MSRVGKNSWWKQSNGYIQGRIWEGDERRIVLQHRYIMEQVIGRRLSTSEDVHHKNGDRADNRTENLELITHSNHSSKTGSERNRPWVKGVLFHKGHGRWYGQLKRNKRRYTTRYFKAESEARMAYKQLLSLVEGRQ